MPFNGFTATWMFVSNFFFKTVTLAKSSKNKKKGVKTGKSQVSY
jgi:hypothetical protein